MEQKEKNLPLSTVALAFGILSIPLAFAAHLCSLALVLGVLAMIFGGLGTRNARRHLLRYTAKSERRARRGLRSGMVGTTCAVIMWVLWATNTLFP